MNVSVDLLDSIRIHLVDFELPGLWSIDITTSATKPSVSMQLASHQRPGITSRLLPGQTPSPRSPPRHGGYQAASRCTRP